MPAEEDIRLAHVITHPRRYQIVKLLRSRKKAYIKEIADELEIDRKVVAFHLRVLEREKLLNTSLKTKVPTTGNPVLVRYAKLTNKTLEILAMCGL